MQAFEHPDFEVLEPLGRGAQAVVFRARHIPLDRPVAIKVLRNAEDAELVGRLLREARLIAGLKHPHLVQVYDVGTLADGRPFVVMECVAGPTLQVQTKAGALPVAQALRIAVQLAGALGAAHALDIVHRDVKPANVLMDGTPDKPWAKLADFGVARPDESDLTQAGVAMGTPAYMAPECFRGEVSAASDVYALGMVLHELLAGERPFQGSNPAEWMFHHLSTPISATPPRRDIPQPVWDAVRRLLAKDPKDRPADGSAAEDLLAKRMGEQDPTLAVAVVPEATLSGRGAMGWSLGLAAVLILAVGLAVGGAAVGLGAGALVWMGESSPPAVPDPGDAVVAPAAAPETPAAVEPPEGPVEPDGGAEAADEDEAEGTRPVDGEDGVADGVEVRTPEAPAIAAQAADGVEPAEPVAVEPAAIEVDAEPAAVEPVAVEPVAGEADAEAAAVEPIAVEGPTPNPETAPTPAFVAGTFSGAAAGRPVSVELVEGPAPARAVLTVMLGAKPEPHVMQGRATAVEGGWVLELSEVDGGPWALQAEVTDGGMQGTMTIQGKRRTAFTARR